MIFCFNLHMNNNLYSCAGNAVLWKNWEHPETSFSKSKGSYLLTIVPIVLPLMAWSLMFGALQCHRYWKSNSVTCSECCSILAVAVRFVQGSKSWSCELAEVWNATGIYQRPSYFLKGWNGDCWNLQTWSSEKSNMHWWQTQNCPVTTWFQKFFSWRGFSPMRPKCS